MMEQNAERSTERLMSSSGRGHTGITSRLPSPSTRHSSGAMTVVLPCPMIIWHTRLAPARADATKSRTCIKESSEWETQVHGGGGK